MIILGIHDGHNSGATLIEDGVVLASVCEERLTRTKNALGFPAKSIHEVLSIAGKSAQEVDRVAFASNFMHSADHLANASKWYRAGVDDQKRDGARDQSYLEAVFTKRREERLACARQHLGVSSSVIEFVEHHLSHAGAAYYGSPFVDDSDVLILTCDGAGDGLSATVSVGSCGKIRRLATTSRSASLGKIYSRVTHALGLTPWEHEYKVMGLAPYADSRYAKDIELILSKLIKVRDDGLGFENCGAIESSYIYDFLRENLECKRFDAIAGGVQMFTERLMAEWVSKCVRSTGISRVACGGGVFMNVKANKVVAEIEGLEELFVFPSCGDESLSFGAAWVSMAESQAIDKLSFGLDSLYLGRGYSRDEVAACIAESGVGNQCDVVEFGTSEINNIVAGLLADNQVVARCSGRMEWGARALGNRSILANPKEWSNVEKINAMIKKRDFWMPFAPSMVVEKSSSFILNPKNIDSPFMMMAYDVTDFASKNIGAAIHPRDKTARAQIVRKEQNPEYWDLINKFGELTGSYCLLNTSFNLHGFPLVSSPAEAIEVFLNSGLDNLVLDGFLLSKKN